MGCFGCIYFLLPPQKKGESFKINIICLSDLLEKGTWVSKFCSKQAGLYLQGAAGVIDLVHGSLMPVEQLGPSSWVTEDLVAVYHVVFYIIGDKDFSTKIQVCLAEALELLLSVPLPQPPALFLLTCHAHQLSSPFIALPACLSRRVQPHYFCPLCYAMFCHLCPLLSLFLRSFITISAGNASPIDFKGQ